jgi:PPK2 family polyphosphate:nucleotide phosphotransferase
MAEQQYHGFEPAFRVPAGKSVELSRVPTAFKGESVKKSGAKKALAENITRLSEAQELLWASSQNGVLLIFQAMDAAGKDGTIKHVMSGVNPQGVEVYSFKAPTLNERMHHFLWRGIQRLPARGRITIFNRSYYEEVLVVRVHPEFLIAQNLPQKTFDDTFWKTRFEDINNFERMITRNGTMVLKFFLHVSHHEQKERFLKRLEDPHKMWKFSEDDYRERRYWKKYMRAYEQMLAATSTEWASWYIIPADQKWFMRMAVADIIATRIRGLELAFPTVTRAHRERLNSIRKKLREE